MAAQLNISTARLRPAFAIRSRKGAFPISRLMTAARSRANRSGSTASKGLCCICSRWHEDSGVAVDDDFLDPSHRARDDCRFTSHRFEIDDPERLVDRRATKEGRRHTARARGAIDHPLDPDDAVVFAFATSTATFISAAISGVSGAPAQSTIWNPPRGA